MAKEFVKTENGFWSCGCERFTNMVLAHKLMEIHIRTDIPIYYDSEDVYKSHELRVWEYVDGTLLKYVCNSNYITVNDESIKIFDDDSEENEEEDDELVDMLEVRDISFLDYSRRIENKLKDSEFLDVTPDRVYKKLLAIEHRLKRLESAKVENSYKTDEKYDIDDKLNKLVGSNFYSVGYIKIRECFPPEARSSFTLCKADHGLSDYDDDGDVETYLADSEYTEYYHIVVKDGIIIETR